jgi:hypothetical protein
VLVHGPVEFLSDEQAARFGRFVAEPSPLELERCFRPDAGALRLSEDPTAVPAGVAALVAEQLQITEPLCLQTYAESERFERLLVVSEDARMISNARSSAP